MCYDETRALSFESLFTDPLIRLVMDSDGITARDMVETLESARAAVERRQRRDVVRIDLARMKVVGTG